MKYAAACVHIKNEKNIIKEWMAFHRAVGFDHLFVIDNNSSDESAQIVRSFVDPTSVTYLYQPIGNPTDFSTTLIKTFGQDYRWMAFIDADEFLFPSHGGDIRAALADYEQHAAVCVYWQIYGSNSHVQKPSELVIDAYTRKALPDYYLNRHVKSIVDPRKVICPMGSHMFKVAGGCIDEKYRPLHDDPPHGYFEDMNPSVDILRINHYHVRSRIEYEEKARRGYFGVDDDKLQKDREHFEMMWSMHNVNDIEDLAAQQYKARMKFYL